MRGQDALNAIRRLCDEAARGWTYGENSLIPTVRITEVQAILDAPSGSTDTSLTADETELAIWALRQARGWPAAPVDAIGHLRARRALAERLSAARLEALS